MSTKWTTDLIAAVWTLVSYVLILGAWATFARPEWGPLLGFAFGCFAFSIAVQQLYASWTQAKFGSEQIVYLWSSLTLFLLGIGTMLACIPNIKQLGWTANIQRNLFVTSTVFFAFGFITLFRFGASYLYRDKAEMLSGDLPSVFKWRNPQISENNTELIHFIFCIGVPGIALFALDDVKAIPTIVESDPTYFPFQFTKIALCLCGILTGWYLFHFFRTKLQRVRNGASLEGSIRFMAAMGILFFLPCIAQFTTLLPWPAQLPVLAVLGVWFVVFTLLIGYLWLISKNDSETDNEQVIRNVRSLKGTSISMLTICLALTAVLWLAPSLLQIIPFGFVTLGFLTLASAYLPINDLERVKLQQQQVSAASTPIVKTGEPVTQGAGSEPH